MGGRATRRIIGARQRSQPGKQAREGAAAGTAEHPDHAANGHAEVGRTERWGIDIDWYWD